MRPIKLTLSGFIGILSGLGRDEITLDLADLAGDAALVALIGPNGAGKSTIMDNLHPYRVMPSRAGGYSPGSFSYYDQVYGTAASKELWWEHGGVTYRTHLLFKMGGKTKKAEAYLFEQVGSEWIPASISDGTVSDGKTDTYDRIVEHIMGSPEMFFTSAFSAQGRRSLSSYANGEIKSLLSDLLGLDDIIALGAQAADESKAARVHLDAMRGDLARLDQHGTDLDAATREQHQAQQDLATANQDKAAARIALNEAGKRMADMQAQASGNIEVEARRATLQARLQQAAQAVSMATSNAQAESDQARQRCITRQSGLSSEIRTLDEQIRAARKQVDDSQALLARAEEVKAARAAEAGVLADLEKARLSLSTAQADAEAARALSTAIQMGEKDLAGLAKDGAALAARCKDLDEQSALIQSVPCHGSALSDGCPLLQHAHEAKSARPKIAEETEAARNQYRTINIQVVAHKDALSKMGDPGVQAAEAAVRRAQEAVNRNAAVVALAPAITQAESVIAAAQTNIATWTRAAEDKQSSAKTAELESNAEIQAIQARLSAAQAVAASNMEQARADLAALPPPADTSAIKASEAAVQDAERSLAQADQSIAGLNARIGTLAERINQATRALSGADATRARAADLEEDIAQWGLLAKAFGNDGIVALCIDDAGPTLAGYANDLLLSCYGPRFSVAIKTQAETAKGDLKETFDIVVYDGERGDAKSVRAMSGGERIWINEALTRAIALYQGHTHGRHYECLFADESDGALDPERKAQFMRMKRKVLELGGYQQEIFISHTPELWEMADAVINMEDFLA